MTEPTGENGPCEVCGKSVMVTAYTERVIHHLCVIAMSDTKPQAEMNGADRHRRRRALIKRDGKCCWWCKIDLEDPDITIDHCVPRSAGGTNRLENLRLACDDCNQKRGGVHRKGGHRIPGTPSRPRAQ